MLYKAMSLATPHSPFAPRLAAIKAVLNQQLEGPLRLRAAPAIIAVSKQQPADRVVAALETGHRDFGENRVQEALAKWPGYRAYYPDIRLHCIGALQSNKAADAVALFDVIHTVDRPKIAKALAEAMQQQQKSIPCFIQVNIGEEPQKSGASPESLAQLLDECRKLGLNIVGLMAIPPESENPAPFFALLHKLARRHGLSELSMGMSDDYQAAARLGASYIRLGTALFGPRE